MNLIKKIFPKYETKADLQKQLAYRSGRASFGAILIERDVVKLAASVEFDGMHSPPTDHLKYEITRKMADELAPYIEYDLRDVPGAMKKCLVGSIRVSIPK